MGMLLSLIPPQLWVLALIGTAFGVILGIVPRGAIAAVVIAMFVIAIVGPIIGSVRSALPWWISALLTVVLALRFISWVITLVFGKHTGGHLSALILHDILLAPCRFVGFIFGRIYKG